MGDVTTFNGTTKLDIEVRRVVEGLNPDDFKHILVLGWEKDDSLFSASDTSDVGEMLHLMELFKQNLLNGNYSGE